MTNQETQAAPAVAEGTIGASSDDNPVTRHNGISLSRVVTGGPADQAGMMPGDVVLAIDGRYLYTAQEMNGEILRHKPGTKITIRYRRYTATYEASVVMGAAQQPAPIPVPTVSLPTHPVAEKDYPLTVRVVEAFGSYGPFTCCETVTIRIGTQDFVLVNGYAPHHLESHHSFHRSGACLTHVKVGDYLHVQGPIAEGKGGKSGPTSADGRYMYFGVLNSQGKTCKAAVLGVGESSSLSNHEQ